MEYSTEDTPLPLEVVKEPQRLSDDDLERMKEYHLDDLRDTDTHELLGFVCTGIDGMKGPCGMRYPSLEDRMMKRTEECSGCFIKMAHG